MGDYLLEEEYKKALEKAVQSYRDLESGNIEEIKMSEEEEKRLNEWEKKIYEELGINSDKI